MGRKYDAPGPGRIELVCYECGIHYWVNPGRIADAERHNRIHNYCGNACRAKGRARLNRERGITDRFIEKNGYVSVYQPTHPYASTNGCVREHRLVAEKMLGRYLRPGESVHHKNGIKHDNRPENLEVLTKHTHIGTVTCPHCGGTFAIR